jgi:thermitase
MHLKHICCVYKNPFKKPEEAMKFQKMFQILVGVMLLSSLILLPTNSLASASVARQAEIPADGEFVPGELIVGIKESGLRSASANVRSIAASVNAEIASVAINNSFYVVRFNSESDLEANMQAFAAMPGVAYVERNGIVSVSAEDNDVTREGTVDVTGTEADNSVGGDSVGDDSVSDDSVSGPNIDSDITSETVSALVYKPNDPLKGNQWYLDRILYYMAPAPVSTANVPCVVILDTGVNYNHPDLAGKVYQGVDIVGSGTVPNSDMDPMDEHGHGTRAAGVIAARAGNGVGIAGISPFSNILAVRVLGADGKGTYADIANGILWANSATASNCGGQVPKIYNFSLSGEQDNSAISAALATARGMGRLIIASAGDINPKPLFPAANVSAFGVASSDNNDKRSYKSNFDQPTLPWLDFVAPGYDIYTTTLVPGDPSTLYAREKGDVTLSSAIAAGAAARVWAAYPSYSADWVMSRLQNTADVTAGGFATAVKRLNLARALGYTKIVLQGQIFDARTSGPLTKATVTVLSSANKRICAIVTNESGFFTCQLPAKGNYSITVKKSKYITLSQSFTKVTKSIFTANQALSPVIGTGTSGDWGVTILWKGWQPFDTIGKEFDLWVVKYSGAKKCYSPREKTVVNKYILPGIDSFGIGQTENIRIKKAFRLPLQVWVSLWDGPTADGYAWPSASRLTGSGLTAVIYKNNKIVARLNVPTSPTASTSDLWYLGIIDPAKGTWKLANKIFTDNSAPACMIVSKP